MHFEEQNKENKSGGGALSLVMVLLMAPLKSKSGLKLTLRPYLLISLSEELVLEGLLPSNVNLTINLVINLLLAP